MLVLPNHHPVVLAKRAATLDALSGGRLRLCVGVGWLREEIEACGTEFASRGRRADEQLAVLRALWNVQPDGVTHRGEFFQFDNVVCSPKPITGQHLPVHIGGHSKAAARRAGRLGDGFQPLGVAGAQLAALLALMRDEAAAAGRDPGDIELTLGHSVSKIDSSVPDGWPPRAPTGLCWRCRRSPTSSRPRTNSQPAPNDFLFRRDAQRRRPGGAQPTSCTVTPPESMTGNSVPLQTFSPMMRS